MSYLMESLSVTLLTGVSAIILPVYRRKTREPAMSYLMHGLGFNSPPGV